MQAPKSVPAAYKDFLFRVATAENFANMGHVASTPGPFSQPVLGNALPPQPTPPAYSSAPTSIITNHQTHSALYQTVPVYTSPPNITGAASTPSEEGDLDNWEDYISYSPGPLVMEEKPAESAMEEKLAESAMEEKPAESAKVDVEMEMRPVTKEDVTQLPSWPAYFWNNLKLVMAYSAPFSNCC